MPLGTPYVTPAMLINAPTGVSWSIIPNPKSTQAQQLAEATNMCWRATSDVDSYVHQVLRSTANTELLSGPGMPRCTVDPNTLNGVLIMRRWPITSVLAIQTALSGTFPRVWSAIPSGNWAIRHPLIWSQDSASATAPDGGWTIDVAPTYLDWAYGRGGQQVQVSYINGWPHTAMTASCIQGATTLTVDDVTGWAGASGFIYDGSSTEQVSIASVAAATPVTLPNGAGTVQAGPGTITLTSGTSTAFSHTSTAELPIMVSALPATVIEATVYFAAAQALEAGIDAIAVQSMAGGMVSAGGSVKDLVTEAELKLDWFRRLI